MKTYKDIFIFIVLAVIFTALTLKSACVNSPTADEVAHHIPTGYVFLTEGDISYATDSPVLPRYLAGLPLVFMDIELPRERSFWAREDRAEFSREFLYELNRPLAGTIVFRSRISMVLTGLFGGVFLFFWLRRRFDPDIALLGSFFYFLSPNIMAHAGLATTDISATVFIMCSVLTFWDLIISPSAVRSITAGLFLGLALLSKYSALLLLPLYLTVFIFGSLFRGKKEKGVLLGSIACAVVSFIILWAGNLLEFRPFLEGVLRAAEKEEIFRNIITSVYPSMNTESLKYAVNMLYTVPVPLSSYILGVLGVLKHGSEGAAVFFMGEWSDKGHPLYYALAFLIKTPVPVIISFLAGMFFIAGDMSSERRFKLYLLFITAVFFIAASLSDLQLGLRYVLPVYPLIFIVAAFGIKTLVGRSGFFKVLSFIMIIWVIAGQMRIYPHYLSYFNEICGGPKQGYRYLRDSNIDWGQDLPSLKAFMTDNDIKNVRLDYFGEADPSYYDIEYAEILPGEKEAPVAGVYAISVNRLDDYTWTKDMDPDAYAGYSIYIYDLNKKR